MMWVDCDEQLKNDYLARAKLPEPRAQATSHRIEKLHPITNTVIKTYSSMADVLREYKFSRQKLFDDMKYGHIAKGFKWRLVDAA